MFAFSHNFILWSRCQQYHPSGLQDALSRNFNYYIHDTVAICINFHPYWWLNFRRIHNSLYRASEVFGEVIYD